MTLAIEIKWTGMALVTQHTENARQEDQGDMVLATEGIPDSSNKMERFSYKSECANA